MSGQLGAGRRFLTLEEAAVLLKESPASLSAAIRRGDLPAIDLGRRGGVRVERAVLGEYAATRQIPFDVATAGDAPSAPAAAAASDVGPVGAADLGEREPRGLSVGDADGHGRYGVLEETDEGMLCVECGWAGRHLGLHAFRAHGLSADDYRTRHGLRRRRGLVASETRKAIQDNGRAGLVRRPLFMERRDPAAATRSRLRQAKPASPQAAAARDERMSAIGRSARLGLVVECERCLVTFCPVGSNLRRRRFCSRSCAAKSTRRGGWTIARARATAATLLGELESWAHTHAVGGLAEQLLTDGVLDPDLAVAAWLHDIGYATSITDTGFPALDAARYLIGLAAPTDLVGLVAWHTGAWFEADERGLRPELERVPEPDIDDLGVITMLHLVVGLDGQPTSPTARLALIKRDHASDHPLHRSIHRSRSQLLSGLEQARGRLKLPAKWPR